jgi:hypothetical protein
MKYLLYYLALFAGVFGTRNSTYQKDTPKPCVLIIPDNPLSPEGLAKPYELVGCDMVNKEESTFVQAVIFDPDTGIFYSYAPLVVNFNVPPPERPVPPKLPPNGVIGIWFGSNADTLVLQNDIGIMNGKCVNGLGKEDVFGQFAYCNAPAFFDIVYKNLDKLNVPPLGVASDGLPCPTAQDFLIVDADPSDNLHTTYLGFKDGSTVQDTPVNRQRFNNLYTILMNPSDESLLTNFFYPAMGCTGWRAIDLTVPGQLTYTLALNEIHAKLYQAEPKALIPSMNPMVLSNGKENLAKLNLYRVGVDQPIVTTVDEASTVVFCKNYIKVGLNRIRDNQLIFQQAPPPDATLAINLYLFLLRRFKFSFNEEGLGCTKLLNIKDPIVLTEVNGLVTDATIDPNVFQNF